MSSQPVVMSWKLSQKKRELFQKEVVYFSCTLHRGNFHRQEKVSPAWIWLTSQSYSDLMSYRAALAVQKLYLHVTKIIKWFGMEEENGLYSLAVLGTCWSKNGSKMVLQSLELSLKLSSYLTQNEWVHEIRTPRARRVSLWQKKSIKLPEQYSFAATCRLFLLASIRKNSSKNETYIFTKVLHNRREIFLVAGLHFIRQTCRLGETCVLCRWPRRNICKCCLLIEQGTCGSEGFGPQGFCMFTVSISAARTMEKGVAGI